MKRGLLISFVLVCFGANASAQQPAPPASASTENSLTAGAKRSYDIIKGYIVRAAEKMPEENYSFKPTPEVRSFGELIGHIADSNFVICSTVAGEKPPAGGFDPASSLEKTKTSKTELSKAVSDSFAYCDKVHAGMTDAKGAEMLPKTFVGPMSKLSFLEFNTHHDFEHYGNVVTYMRLKGLVPPSSERTQ